MVIEQYRTAMTKEKRKETKGQETTGIADIAGLIKPETRRSQARREARILLWVFAPEEARNHIERNLERTRNTTENDTLDFWLEVEATFNAIVAGETDEVEEFIHLLSFVDSLEPRENWIVPLLEDVPFRDFRAQLFAAVEDYKKM